MGHTKSKLPKPKSTLENIQMKEQKKTQIAKIERQRLEKLAKKKPDKLTKNKPEKIKNHTIQCTSLSSSPAEPAHTANMKMLFKDYEQTVAQKLENQIHESFAYFLLNQIILSIQFFANYDDETATANENIFKQENEKNEYLDKHTIIFPNALDDAVEKRIQYKSKHGPDKNIQIPLQIQTMYIIFENVEISKPDDANYDSISPICKVDIDSKMVGPSKKYKGFLRLRLRESTNRNDIKLSTTSSNESTIDSIYMTQTIQNQTKELQLTPEYETLKLNNFHNSNIVDILSGDSEYAYITSLNTHHPLSELTNSTSVVNREILDRKALPEYCITFVNYNVDIDDETDIESDTESLNDTIEFKYLNSKSFLCYFATLLQDHLAAQLNLNNNEFVGATWKGASIYTKSYEIIPAIQIRCWPDCAFEWKHRKRPIRINPNNNQRLQWPTPKMIKKIESFGCHVIPQGHAPKTHKNPYRELEWKIVFPKAERYLETNLTPTQVKIFMIAKTLMKTFLEPQQKKDTFMFTMDHLRMHLFWQCEENFGAWPEEFLGEVLIRFLRSFLECTRKKHLPDYFISGRNLFESIPESTLSRVHMIVSQIIQNPVMHIMIAYRNLEQVEVFFPKLNYKRLYEIIQVENPLKLMENVAGVNREADDDSEPNKMQNSLWTNGMNEDEDDNGLIGYSQRKERKSIRSQARRIKNRERRMSNKRRKTSKYEARVSIDSIDLQFIFSTNLEGIKRNSKDSLQSTYDNLRRILAIEMFVKHFIALAKNFCQLNTLNYSRMYLNQATRLCPLLRKLKSDVSANNFLTSIEKVKANIEALRFTESDLPPALPKRTSLEPVKFFHLNESNAGQIEKINNNNNQENKIISQLKQSPIKQRAVHFNEPSSFAPVQFVCDAEIHRPAVILRMNSKESANKTSVRFNSGSPSANAFSKQDNFKNVKIDKNSNHTGTHSRGGILKQTSVELNNNDRSSTEEIHKNDKDYSQLFQLRKSHVHRSLIKNLMLKSGEETDGSSTDL